jgi:hypothetical protein
MNSPFQAGLYDELAKIAGSMQGHVRKGRKPIGVEKLIEKQSELPKASDIYKYANAAVKAARSLPVSGKDVALLGGGALVYHQGRKIKRRYELGRQMELQNQGF